MSPYYAEAGITLWQGDNRAHLKHLPDGAFNTCVTSPPYFGLRDYGTATWTGGDENCSHRIPATGSTQNKGNNNKEGRPFCGVCGVCGALRTDNQIGLEPTPEAYVAEMVAVFREVRRCLRDDGTLFLNIGDSYYGGGGYCPTAPSAATSKSGKYGRQGALIKGHTSGASVAPHGARKRGTSCIEPPNSLATDFAYSGLCDECSAAIGRRILNSGQPLPESALLSETTGRGISPADFALAGSDAVLQSSPVSTSLGSSSQRPGECSHCDNCGACLSVLRSSSRDASLCVRRAGYMNGSGLLWSANHNQDRGVSGLASGYSTTAALKSKDLIGIPWMLAFALRADGWYLRSDIIWAKGISFCPEYSGSVMPESVTDRPTKAHEYLFLLSKSDRYYFDADAIKEQSLYPDDNRAAREQNYALASEGISRLNPASAKAYPKRNVRSVWAINTRNYDGAHFATFPEDLVRPCIMAGSPAGGAVLEPFAGSGTTLKVARDLGRQATGIELNPAYCGLVSQRLAQGVLFSAEATA